MKFQNEAKEKKMMTNLEKLQSWYIQQIDGDWEHTYGIKIDTLDNAGWILQVDLAETPHQNLNLAYQLFEESDTDWYFVKTQNQKFEAGGDPTKLDFLIEKFFEVIKN